MDFNGVVRYEVYIFRLIEVNVVCKFSCAKRRVDVSSAHFCCVIYGGDYKQNNEDSGCSYRANKF